jgi:MSHA pilin protein MshA
MHQQKGFTLIELIIVIVILGILAVTAAPKFIDIQKDAKGGTVKAVDGALNSVSSIVYGKALIAGQTGATGQVTVNGKVYDVVYGYLAAKQTTDTSLNLITLLDIDTEMAPVFEDGAGGAIVGRPGVGTSAIRFYGFVDSSFNYAAPTTTPGCLIIYTQSTGPNVAATVNLYNDGCN